MTAGDLQAQTSAGTGSAHVTVPSHSSSSHDTAVQALKDQQNIEQPVRSDSAQALPQRGHQQRRSKHSNTQRCTDQHTALDQRSQDHKREDLAVSGPFIRAEQVRCTSCGRHSLTVTVELQYNSCLDSMRHTLSGPKSAHQVLASPHQASSHSPCARRELHAVI